MRPEARGRGLVRLRWWRPDAVDAATLAAWHATLDVAEQAAAARFRFAADRHAYIAAHALARQMLSAAGGLPPEAWRFTRTAAGKPELEAAHGMPWLRFNLSHTRTLVACATTARDDLGLDVEDVARAPASPALAQRYFAAEEAALLAALPQDRRHEAFLRIWTLKEAFVKATGAGIALGLDRFAVALDPPRLCRLPAEAGALGDWRFLQWQPTRSHILAMALRRAL